ncbi:MAG: hypothetical protein OXG02_05790 [Chloroflexi bacterium]|nr:hypothetical protein [Chloroflexota bacterium]
MPCLASIWRRLECVEVSRLVAFLRVIIVILFFQKQLVKGLAAGAVKG